MSVYRNLRKKTIMQKFDVIIIGAGLRSFVADRGPVIEFNKTVEGFSWLAGQGGFGVQTAPAAKQLAAALISQKTVPEDMRSFGLEETMTSRHGVISSESQCLEKRLKF